MRYFCPLFLLSFLLSSLICSSQGPAEKLNKWASENPIEKIYLHLDREDYLPGQTLWLKAYLYSEFLASDKSTTLFVELISPSSTVLSKLTLPVIRGVTQGQFDLPDTLSGGKYLLRAYTATMLNHDMDFIYRRTIQVRGKSLFASTRVGTPRMEFFPEGGNFIAGQPNTIAFKSTDENGLPVNASGKIVNDMGELVTEFKSYHDGMGMMDIEAKEGQTYTAILTDDPSGTRFPLPVPSKEGIVFRLMTGEKGIHFEILQKKNDPVFNAAYMIGQMQHNVVFTQPFTQGAASLTGVIKTENLASGILHITVFNKEGMPLAERLSFVNNKEFVLQATLTTDTINFSPRSKNRLTLSLKDTVIGSFSVSITDPNFDAGKTRKENIISSILLSGDLKGYVHEPAYYFNSETDSVRYALDLVMMTNGWRRFRWEPLVKNAIPPNTFKDPGFITLSGKVTLEGTRKPFAEKELLLFILAADSSRTMQLIKTNANGEFLADSLVFFGKTNILFSDIKGKKSKFVDIKPGPDSLNRPYPIPFTTYKELGADDTRAANAEIARRLADEYDAYVKATGLVLSEIIIRSRKKSALEELEERYATGGFSGDTRKTFDLLNTNEALSYQNIFDFLEAKVPGLIAGRSNDGDYYVFFRQMATISSMGNQQMDVFLDEVLTDANTVAFINPSQIALVKVYSSFVGSTGGGAGGALAIYLKKGADYFNSLPSAGEMLTTTGYSIIREFYSPDYKVPAKPGIQPDHRLTLYWKPDIFVSGINARIPLSFYNNDRSTGYKIVVEGMTIDGKMLLVEKTIRGNEQIINKN